MGNLSFYLPSIFSLGQYLPTHPSSVCVNPVLQKQSSAELAGSGPLVSEWAGHGTHARESSDILYVFGRQAVDGNCMIL